MELISTNNAYIGNGAVGVDERSEILFLRQTAGWLSQRVKTKYGVRPFTPWRDCFFWSSKRK
jgi:hypothetical protein